MNNSNPRDVSIGAMKGFTERDWKSINTIRLLSADMVQKANSGHPGAPMGLAPLAHVLFTRHFRCAPSHPRWVEQKDRYSPLKRFF